MAQHKNCKVETAISESDSEKKILACLLKYMVITNVNNDDKAARYQQCNNKQQQPREQEEVGERNEQGRLRHCASLRSQHWSIPAITQKYVLQSVKECTFIPVIGQYR